VNTLLLFFQAVSQASGFPAATHEYHLEELFDYAYWLLRRLMKMRKPPKGNFGNLRKRIKSNAYQLLFSVFLVCFLLVMFGTYEEFVIPSFVIGSVSLIGFLITREKVKGSQGKKAGNKQHDRD